MDKNPFTLMYGMPTPSLVSREFDISTIIDSFVSQDNMFTYLITGIRGSGKTVLLKTVENRLATDFNWAVLNINPQGQILESIANKLYDLAVINKLLGKITVSVNLGVVTVTRESGEKISDPEIVIEHFLKLFKKVNRPILVSIDEVNDNQEFRRFINFYQILIGKDYQLYLLMTALQENVNYLINDKAMTFLSRAPKIVLEPLPLTNVALNYADIFNVDNNEATKMAKLTKGYAFAYQVLGYLLYKSNKNKIDNHIEYEYEQYLWKNGYNKFWKDLTNIERKFLIAIANTNGSKEEIINNGFSSNNYSQYRRRLLEKGLIYSPMYGYLDFVLPRFKEYVLVTKEFED